MKTAIEKKGKKRKQRRGKWHITDDGEREKFLNDAHILAIDNVSSWKT